MRVKRCALLRVFVHRAIILSYDALYRIIFHYTILYYTILYYTILYYTILYCTILYYTILYYTILYYTILYYTILHYTILYYAILYYTIVQYSISNYIMPVSYQIMVAPFPKFVALGVVHLQQTCPRPLSPVDSSTSPPPGTTVVP